ncbi:hypothetical protein B9Z55_011938 [Caenorhabditis nigoni]|uniref:Uncharacterized protein n=1 Tax=Caenorhabditis nigoni TaxID=1611254 RepID=A0A2G5UMA7_9PELO|nr:hypothetical protein B9Z55_011938 [Caenorhabditis nigoni]
MRFFNMLRTVNMLPAVSKKITAPSSSNFLRTNIRELTTQSKHVYATQEVIIGAQKKKTPPTPSSAHFSFSQRKKNLAYLQRPLEKFLNSHRNDM